MWFKKKDPMCGMKQRDGKGIEKNEQWFCSASCLKKYEASTKKHSKPGCCH